VIDKGGEARVKAMLLTGSREDRDDAFRLLESMYRGLIYKYAGRLAWRYGLSFCLADFDEIWQKTLLGAFKHLQRVDYAYSGSLLALLKVITHRRMVDRLRRNIVRQECELFDVDAFTSQWREVYRTELLEEFEKCFETVSPANQDALLVDVRLFFENGRWATNRELAQEMGKNVNTVSSQRTRGRDQIRECLQGKGYDV